MREGYKKTELGEIPVEWEVKKFGSVAKVRSEKFDPLQNENKIYVGLEHIESSTGRLLGIANSNEATSMKSVFKKDDILFGKLRPYLKKYWFANFDGVCATEILPIVANKCFNKFCFYLIQQDKFINYLTSKSFGTKMPRISWKEMSEYLFPIPPLKEQQKIAEILYTVDELIKQTDALIERSKELKKGLMQRLLTKGIGHTEFKKTEVGEIPVEWEVKSLKNLGKTYTGLTGKTKGDFGTGKPYITYKNIFNNYKVDSNFLEYVNVSDNENQNKVKYGDIFFTMSSETPDEVGMSSVLLDNVEELYLNSFCIGYRLNDFKTLLPEFACYLLRGTKVRRYMKRIAQGSTRYNLSKDEVLKILVALPPLKEQKDISNILMYVDKEILQCELKKQKLQTLKQGLMQKLLTGKIRVKVS